jgi:hypothetical protein
MRVFYGSPGGARANSQGERNDSFLFVSPSGAKVARHGATVAPLGLTKQTRHRLAPRPGACAWLAPLAINYRRTAARKKNFVLSRRASVGT